MGNVFSRMFDRFRGSGDAAITLPPMDGALRPNTRIEDAEAVLAVAAPDNLLQGGDGILLSSGAQLLRLDGGDGKAELLWTASSDITCIAASPSGALAIGLSEGRLTVRGGKHNGAEFSRLGDLPILCPSALAFADDDTLLVCLGSQDHPMCDWKIDLMSHGSSGSVWKIDLVSGTSTCLAKGLAFPYGMLARENGDVIVSESWRHRVLQISPDLKVRTVIEELPGYPSRLTPDQSNGCWLSIFAPRTQLIEFVLRENEYRHQMIETIDPEYWIAPSLHHPKSYLEPMQGGSLKQLGELKPWAPSRSLGILVRLDENGLPVESLHSRADGVRHGVTSCLPSDGELLLTCKGGDVVVRAKI